MDTLVLIFIIPLVLIPLIFLLGFSGCGALLPAFEEDTTAPPPPPPVPGPLAKPFKVRANPKSLTEIELLWEDTNPIGTKFTINRQNPPAKPLKTGIPDKIFIDNTLGPPSTPPRNFSYTVQAQALQGPALSIESDPAVTTVPLAFYAAKTILPTPNLIALWALDEPAGATKALARKQGGQIIGSLEGTYTTATPYTEVGESAAAPGTISSGNWGIIPGDWLSNLTAQSTCVYVDGGYVRVGFDPALNPTQAEGWTVEAWVRPDWTDSGFWRLIVASTETTATERRGYELSVNPANRWSCWVGGGTTILELQGPQVSPQVVTYLALTYDGASVWLYVDGILYDSKQINYAPNQSRPLYIGTGGTQSADPKWPFRGNIQCVAVYKGALPLQAQDHHDIFTHNENGRGRPVWP